VARFHFPLRPLMARLGHVGGLLRVKELLQERRNRVSTLSKWLQLLEVANRMLPSTSLPKPTLAFGPRCCVNGRSNWLAPPPREPIDRWGRFCLLTYHVPLLLQLFIEANSFSVQLRVDDNVRRMMKGILISNFNLPGKEEKVMAMGRVLRFK
jgi:hypothetical protein